MKSVFPLGGIRKEDVRRLAKFYNLPTADRAESMGVCFIGERGRFGDFICTSDVLVSSCDRILTTLTPGFSAIHLSAGFRIPSHTLRRQGHTASWNVVLYDRSRCEITRNEIEVVCCEKGCRGGRKRYTGRPRTVSLYLTKRYFIHPP